MKAPMNEVLIKEAEGNVAYFTQQADWAHERKAEWERRLLILKFGPRGVDRKGREGLASADN